MGQKNVLETLYTTLGLKLDFKKLKTATEFSSEVHLDEEKKFLNGMMFYSHFMFASNSQKFKAEKLTAIALATVDIKGVGLYTLGSYIKNLSEEKKKKIYNFI